MLADGFHHGIEAGGVVGTVDQDARSLAEHLHSAGEGDFGQPFHGAGVVDGDTAAFETIDDAEGQAAVDRLVLADEGNGQVLEFAVGRGEADPVMRAEHAAGFEPVAEFDCFAGDVEGAHRLFRRRLTRAASASGS